MRARSRSSSSTRMNAGEEMVRFPLSKKTRARVAQSERDKLTVDNASAGLLLVLVLIGCVSYPLLTAFLATRPKGTADPAEDSAESTLWGYARLVRTAIRPSVPPEHTKIAAIDDTPEHVESFFEHTGRECKRATTLPSHGTACKTVFVLVASACRLRPLHGVDRAKQPR